MLKGTNKEGEGGKGINASKSCMEYVCSFCTTLLSRSQPSKASDANFVSPNWKARPLLIVGLIEIGIQPKFEKLSFMAQVAQMRYFYLYLLLLALYTSLLNLEVLILWFARKKHKFNRQNRTLFGVWATDRLQGQFSTGGLPNIGLTSCSLN